MGVKVQHHFPQNPEKVFDKILPYEGTPPPDFFVDFLGTLIHKDFRIPNGANELEARGDFIHTRLPRVTDGEGFFEAANWVMSAANAVNEYNMITLGACYGGQAVGAALTLLKINPLPFKLVAVEPEPTNIEWVKRHMRDNGIDPKNHWLLNLVLGANNEPIFFPVGEPAIGAQNAIASNELAARINYVEELILRGDLENSIRILLLENRTNIRKQLIPSANLDSEIKLMSAITLDEVLGPFDQIDYLESDIQQSELIVFPPALKQLISKVKMVHIGTHGKDVHNHLRDLFVRDNWIIQNDFLPNTEYETNYGNFTMNDGVLTLLNPHL